MFILVVLLLDSLVKAQIDNSARLEISVKSAKLLIKSEIQGGDCRCYDSILQRCPEECPFLIIVHSNGLDETSEPPTASHSKLFVLTSPKNMRAYFNLTIEFRIMTTQEMVESFEMSNFNLVKNKQLNLKEQIGKMSQGLISAQFRWICPHNFDSNCHRSCVGSSYHSFCDPLTGEHQCPLGFKNPPTCEAIECKLDTCANGICLERLNEVICNCKAGFFGRFCELTT